MYRISPFGNWTNLLLKQRSFKVKSSYDSYHNMSYVWSCHKKYSKNIVVLVLISQRIL